MQFQLQHTDLKSGARAGKLITDHGEIETPIFMPVGTVGSVKAVHQKDKKDLLEGDCYVLFFDVG